MPATIPALSTPLPTTSGMTEAEYNTAMNRFIDELTPYAEGANTLAAEAEANAARAEAAAAEVANTVWVSGTPYTAGQVRYSPVDFLSYRRKTDGAGTTDPSQDPTNWELQTSTSVGGADTTSSATDITLTFTSGRLQIIAMTAAGKKVTAPAATTLKKGTPLFVVKNAGNYRFSFHKNGGGFVCYVDPGQVLAFHCSDTSTGAGVWHVSGQDIDQIYGGNTADVLNAVDTRYIAVAMTIATQAVCAFKNQSTSYLDAVVINYGSASGTPAQVVNHNAQYISIAAQTNNQVTICYKKSTGETHAVVLDINSATTFVPGTAKQIDAGTGGTGTAITALSATQLLTVYQGTSAATPKMRVLDISASAVNESAEAASDTDAALNSVATCLRVRTISAIKTLFGFRRASDSRVRLRLQSITGSTPASTGSALDLVIDGTAQGGMFGAVVFNATRAIIVQSIDRTYGDIMVALIDISGTTPVLLSRKIIRGSVIATELQIDASRLDNNHAYIMFTGAGDGGVDGFVVTVTAEDRLIIAPISSKLEPSVTAGNEFLFSIAALDANHVMLCCRNASTYLSAKTLELPS